MFDSNLVQNNFIFQYGGSTPSPGNSPLRSHALIIKQSQPSSTATHNPWSFGRPDLDPFSRLLSPTVS